MRARYSKLISAATILLSFLLKAQSHDCVIKNTARVFAAGGDTHNVKPVGVDETGVAKLGREVVKGARVGVLPIQTLAVIVAALRATVRTKLRASCAQRRDSRYVVRRRCLKFTLVRVMIEHCTGGLIEAARRHGTQQRARSWYECEKERVKVHVVHRLE
jgi:hypothetical protein